HARHPYRLVLLCPAQHGLVDQLRPRHVESELAVVRRHRAVLALRRRPGLGQRFPAGLPSGHARCPRKEPIPNVRRQSTIPGVQEMELGLASAFNRQDLKQNGNDTELAYRIRTFETAFQMQFEAPEAFDLSKETEETLNLYGLKRGDTESFAWQCLVARRLAERGVRFIELIDTGSSNNWDAHSDMAAHAPLAKKIDQPIAGLIQDLKRRGLLDDTLVVWTSEFGRTPGVDGPKGRGHHPAAYSSWLAGGGVKGGLAYGQSDEIGATVAENKVHVHDFHATILHL